MLIESDYFWRSVINPDGGNFPMEDRDDGRRLGDDPGLRGRAARSAASTARRCRAVGCGR